MSIIFGIILIANTLMGVEEKINFIDQTLENNKKHDCEFVYKGFSKTIDKPAWSLYGYTLFKQKCNE